MQEAINLEEVRKINRVTRRQSRGSDSGQVEVKASLKKEGRVRGPGLHAPLNRGLLDGAKGGKAGVTCAVG